MGETLARASTIAFDVHGLPPLKNEALSIFSAGHRQAGRVRTLLEAACAAAQRTGWTALAHPVALDVVLRRPPDHHSGDVTNFLSGIGAVLQDKRRSAAVSVAHLGVLVDVALYVDDRQIRQLSYREEHADEPSYTVRVSTL
ncbi:hypothetical protein GCM10023170_013490 [Phytohabitans houttuyneae]|uniref:Uncharacterized protein n=1 Tax=Phytohabitans houttuyneae TaxID=1076126 RepID=A0A6V8KU66_9ACTN|nr:hypothetical protein [Phytohabitans houttuyneae]GFJ86238.1 hypothetical protein Phou_104180 [Phytohabitans houttuyneae]